MVINAEGCKSYRLDLRGPAEQKIESKAQLCRQVRESHIALPKGHAPI